MVLEGVYFRFQHGATLGPGFDGIAEMVQPLIDQGLAGFGESRLPDTSIPAREA